MSIKNILLNSGSNVFVLFLKIALTFIMAPILIRNLGNYDYGLWEMFGAVLGYMGMLDLGLGPTVSRYAALHRGDGDRKSQQCVFNSALVFMVIVGALLALSFYVWATYFPSTIAPVGAETQKYTFLLLAFAVQVLVFFPGLVAESYLEGFQRYQVKNLIVVVNSLIGTAILYSYINPENGLLLLAAVNVIGGSIKYFIYLFFITRPSLVGVKYNLSDFSLFKLKELLVFGSKSLIQGLATRVETSTDSLVIGYFLGPASVPFYSIIANLVQYIRSLAATATHVFMPIFSSMIALDDKQLIVRFYVESSKYVVSFVACVSTGVLLFGLEFVALWIGPEFAESFLLLALIVGFISITLLNPMCGRYLVAFGKHGILARIAPLSAVSNILISCQLVQVYGIEGVAAGSLIPSIFVVPFLLHYCCKGLEIKVSYYLIKAVLPSLLPLCIMISTSFLVSTYIEVTDYSSLIVSSLVAGFAFYATFLFTGLSEKERCLLISKLKRVRNIEPDN